MCFKFKSFAQRNCPHEFHELRTYFPLSAFRSARRYDLYCPTCELFKNFVHYAKAERIFESQKVRATYLAKEGRF